MFLFDFTNYLVIKNKLVFYCLSLVIIILVLNNSHFIILQMAFVSGAMYKTVDGIIM